MDSILKSIKKNLSKDFDSEVIKFILIGSRISNNYRNEADFDIVIVVNDHSKIYDLVKNMSFKIYEISINLSASIGVYPISTKNFLKGKSQFIDNVILNGIEF